MRRIRYADLCVGLDSTELAAFVGVGAYGERG